MIPTPALVSTCNSMASRRTPSSRAVLSLSMACCAAMHEAVSAPTAKQMLTIVSSCHTLSVARVSCPLTVPLHNESAGSCCHAKMIPVSKHPFKYLATRLNLWQLLTRCEKGGEGGMQWPWGTTSRRTVYLFGSSPGRCAPLQSRLVCIQVIVH